MKKGTNVKEIHSDNFSEIFITFLYKGKNSRPKHNKIKQSFQKCITKTSKNQTLYVHLFFKKKQFSLHIFYVNVKDHALVGTIY